MGTGFKLNLKWGFSVQSPFRPNSSYWPSSYSFRGRESLNDSARMSFSSVVSGEIETSYNDHLKRHTCSSALQTLENDYSDTEEIKMNIGKRTRVQMLTGENNVTFLASLQANKTSHFSLLMENLDILEDTFGDTDVVMLERDILGHLERLGALNLFHACLSRTLKAPHFYDLSDLPSGFNEERQMDGPVDDHRGKVVIRSGKKEERKLRRARASETDFHQPKFSSAIRAPNSKSRRLKVARNEAEMSRGVKLVANLERIREILEEETGQLVSMSSWAEAAGIDKKLLKQHLLFGWYCRDELLKSTRSLVLYLARNYKGLGVASEDLVQAGNFGVLQGAERFDHTRGYKFSTYVHYWIRKSMSTLVSQHSRGIRIPYSLHKAINQIQKARKALNNSHGKHLDDDEIAKFTGLSLAKITSASKCLRVVGSLDQKMGTCISAKFVECLPDTSLKSPEETVMRQHMIKEVYNLLNGLDSRERQVLVQRFGLGDHQRKSLEEIGRGFSVSKEWIRKIERKALKNLRGEKSSRSLNHYLYL